MAVIIAREILGPSAMVWYDEEEKDYNIFIYPSWTREMRLDRRHHAKGFDKRNDFIEEIHKYEEILVEYAELVAVGQSWREALTMAREWKDKQTAEAEKEEKEEVKV